MLFTKVPCELHQHAYSFLEPSSNVATMLHVLQVWLKDGSNKGILVQEADCIFKQLSLLGHLEEQSERKSKSDGEKD